MKITQVSPAGSWEGQNGKMFTINVVLEDGTAGEVNAKTADRWNVGDEVEVLQKNETEYGVKLKLDRAGYQGQGGSDSSAAPRVDRQPQIASQWAINAAIAMRASKPGTKQLTVEDVKVLAIELLKTRDEIIEETK